MNQNLVRRRNRTHAIVEGALLGDIAIVFLLMRVYLPVPIVRTLIRILATVPFIVLMQRRGLRLTLLAAIASYLLFCALVGPILALTAIDIAVAGILVGLARKAGMGVVSTTLWSGPAYAVLDLILPTLATVIIFRVPVKNLAEAAKNLVQLVFNASASTLQFVHAPASVIYQVRAWEKPIENHWQLVWLGALVTFGVLNMYLTALISTMVLRQVPEQTLEPQAAAA
jgi:hypothetical protein